MIEFFVILAIGLAMVIVAVGVCVIVVRGDGMPDIEDRDG